ncbi:DUF6049 family protein [Buchananella hordeovulneris]|uniref:DUF6049 family protein n=1 Tax=Buchananella hordeovulneris TaxID=52770 RepID=UPI0011613F75|nr:DUF6049 family protein [Buchananella hordeovulneris]
MSRRWLSGGALAALLLAGVTPTAQAAPEMVKLAVEVQNVAPYVVTGEDVTISGVVRNTGTQAVARLDLAVSMHQDVPGDRRALHEFAAGTPDPSLALVDTFEVQGALPAGGTLPFSLTVPRGQLPVGPDDAWGPRGVEIDAYVVPADAPPVEEAPWHSPRDLDANGPEGSGRTLFIFNPPTDAPVSLAVAQPVVASGAELERALLQGESLEVASQQRLGSFLAGADRRWLTLGVDPMLFADAVETVFSSPPLGTDPATPSPTQPTADSPSPTLAPPLVTPQATQSPQFVLPALTVDNTPSFAGQAADFELVQLAPYDAPPLTSFLPRPPAVAPLPQAHSDVAWPHEASLSEQLVRQLLASPNYRALLLPPETFPAATGTSPVAHTTVSLDGLSKDALVGDPYLPNLLAGLDTRGHALPPFLHRMLLAADTALLRRDHPTGDAGFLALVPRASSNHISAYAESFAFLESLPWVQPTTVTGLLQLPAATQDRTTLTLPQSADEQRLAQITVALDRLTPVTNAVEDRATFRQPFVAAAAILASAQWGPAHGQRHVSKLQSLVDEATDAIMIHVVSEVRMIDSDASLPIRVTNSLPTDVTVTLAVTSHAWRLKFPDQITKTVPANRQVQFMMPSHGVGTGDVNVDVRVLSPEGDVIAGPNAVRVRVRADWENLGVGILFGAAIVLIVVGLVRRFLKNRKSREASVLALPTSDPSASASDATAVPPADGSADPGRKEST